MRVQIQGLAGNSILPSFQQSEVELVTSRLYRFSLPLTRPVQIKNFLLSKREGLILALIDSAGNSGISEISPLPGYSLESLESTLPNTTVLLDKMMRNGEFTAPCNPAMGRPWENSLPAMSSYGIETALLSLLAKQNGTLLGELVFGHTSSRIPINGLIKGSVSEWTSDAGQAVRDGFQTLKFKVGRVDSEIEANALMAVREAVGPDIRIRLDANRRWDLQTAIGFGQKVHDLDIEYIEEPIREPVELPRFFDACSVPFALDETLHQIIDPRISFDTYTGLKALVLKPTLISCVTRFLTLVKRARETGVQTVLSSSYESDVGLNRLAQMAGSISGEEIAAGLDTRSALAKGTTLTPVRIENGWMPLQAIGIEDLDLSNCQLIHEV